MGVMSKLQDAFYNAMVFVWDNGLVVLNLVTPKLQEGRVVPAGGPGANLTWPEYVAPKEGTQHPQDFSISQRGNVLTAISSRRLSIRLPYAQCAGEPRHFATRRQEHHLQGAECQSPPMLQLRTLILFLRTQIRRRLSEPRLLHGQV